MYPNTIYMRIHHALQRERILGGMKSPKSLSRVGVYSFSSTNFPVSAFSLEFHCFIRKKTLPTPRTAISIFNESACGYKMSDSHNPLLRFVLPRSMYTRCVTKLACMNNFFLAYLDTSSVQILQLIVCQSCYLNFFVYLATYTCNHRADVFD